MKLFSKYYLVIVLIFTPTLLHAECEEFKCVSVKIKTFLFGKTGAVIQTNGTESKLACDASHDYIIISFNDSSYKSLENLAKQAFNKDQVVDIFLKKDGKQCEIESITIHS